MNTEKIDIGIKKLNALVLTEAMVSDLNNKAAVLTLNAEMMNLGFIMSKALYERLLAADERQLEALFTPLLDVLKNLLGDDVNYQPMYPGFPKQLMLASELELYINAISHYYTMGEWLPKYKIPVRKKSFEVVKYKEIDVLDEQRFKNIFTQLLSAKDSLSQDDKDIIAWFVSHYAIKDLVIPEAIDFAENKCVLAAELLKKNEPIDRLVKTATDILRIVTHLSGGDVSLASNTQFISLPRATRKTLVKLLEGVINEEDIGRHRNKWVRLFHNLHVGDFSSSVYEIAKKARNNQGLESFYSQLEFFLNAKNIKGATALLAERPGEFGRRIDHLLRLSENPDSQNNIAETFLSVANKIPTRNLLQLLGHLGRRNKDIDQRVVYPKGSVQKAVIVPGFISSLDGKVLSLLVNGIYEVLLSRFSSREPLGKVWVDPDLIDCPLPTQQRSASSGLFNVARGTRLPIGDKDTLRFFIYWVGKDIDLSATFHDESYRLIEHVSYTNLRAKGYKACHSGDIVNAPKGASEFIDIDIESAYRYGARYVAMNVLVYSGPSFAEHTCCYAGWMTRTKPNSNEVYDPKTVAQKIDVRSASRNVIPAVFDLRDRKMIWVDVAMSGRRQWGGNNIESNAASIESKLKAIVESEHKLSLYELFLMHAQARGSIVPTMEMADTVFSLEQGVTPYDINVINGEYID